jgi:thiol-disulfide isomerase/thioredoxin
MIGNQTVFCYVAFFIHVSVNRELAIMTRTSVPIIWLFAALICHASEDELRTWKDSTGKFSVHAELLSIQDGNVVLKTPTGKEITVSLKRLCEEDQIFVRESQIDPASYPKEAPVESKSTRNTKASANVPSTDIANLKELATRFYSDLSSKDRTLARSMLTEAAQSLVEESKSPLAHLPNPDTGKSAVKVGKPKISAQQAIIPVIVRIDGVAQNTSLHLRKVEEEWRVFALSAKMGNEENTINFEAALSLNKKSESPLAKLKDQPISLTGLTLAGTPVSLEKYKGKVVLIDFWATWCGPCRAEIPNILANYQKYHSAGFEVIAISVDRDLDELMSFVKDENPPWVVLADKHPNNRESMANKFGISGIPAFILVGPDGKVLDIDCRGAKLGQRLGEAFGQ